ncbi:Integrase [Gemmobacter aquatilis]|uniref:Integrase n=1 Tax=Gemmobacter aquatilis TaxID=933059 RepID=A0A1H7Z4X1_9RHOB|nr:integrase arm-type DNA-binding domain-containing protein [Gemmobacter aquatilis]SEM53500.1 Integrase [Gemmobacter aquatilis]
MRATNRLTAKGVASAPPGKHADGGNLWLFKREDGGAQWVLRVTIHGRRREMGLGAYPAVSLAEARRKAEDARAKVRDNIDPIKDRERQKREAARNLHLFKDIVSDTFEGLKPTLKGDGVNGRWLSPLKVHVLPKLGNVPVSEIDQIDIRDTLAPIWHTKAETADKALKRIGICIKHAAALGLPVDMQVVDKAKALLGKTRHKTVHIPALPWRDVPDFYASLSEGSLAHLGLRLLILTGVRSDAVRHLQEGQMSGDVWTIPGEAMKGLKDKTPDFRVPLSSEAQAVIAEARKFSRDGFLFPSIRKGVMSDMTMSQIMARRGMKERPHGFRSSLRIWLAEVADAPHEVAETMLAHATGNRVSRSYTRDFDHLDKRRALMERWGQFVSGKASGEVVQLVAKR